MANEENLRPQPFKKNKGDYKDPRINRKGRPKSFHGLRELAKMLADEKAKVGGKTLVVDKHSVTVVEAILRSWMVSKDPRKQKAFMEIAYGKVPDRVDVTSDGKSITPIADKLKGDLVDRIERALAEANSTRQEKDN